jgi:soluble cytochrome b562
MRHIAVAAALLCSYTLAIRAGDHKWAAPAQLSTTQKTDVARIMSTIEQRADSFEHEFLKGLRSSTVNIEERKKYRDWVDQVEDQLDNMAEAYKEGNIAEAHEELTEAMDAARNINHFMLNADWSSEAESTWATIRDDLNTLAKHHSAPADVLIGKR